MQIANQWLELAKNLVVDQVFHNSALADRCHIAYSWPSTKALAKNKTLGEAWQQGDTRAIFISPTLFSEEKRDECLATLAHELIHIEVGLEHGHRGPFVRRMREIGLEGRPTSTHAGERLLAQFAAFPLPPIPEALLDKPIRKTQSTRLVKLVCGCGRILRVSRTVAAEGDIECRLCKVIFKPTT